MLAPPPPPELQARARGLLLGLALGEARGRWHAPPGGGLPLTAEALSTARSLLERREPEPEDLLRRWGEDREREPAGGGSVTQEALRLYRLGRSPSGLADAAARVLPGHPGDAPLTRCLAVALAAGSGARVRQWGRRCAAVTHADPLVQTASVAAALLAWELLRGGLQEGLARVAQALRGEVPGSLLEFARPDPRGGGLTADARAIGTLTASVQSLAQAQDWEGAVALAASRGIPCDPAPALTGALGGALWGDAGVEPPAPGELPPGLAAEMSRLAPALLEVGSGDPGPAAAPEAGAAPPARDA